LLKKESRILGLSTTDTRHGRMFVVGVVFRGRFWLDGIVACWITPKTVSQISKISRTIIASRQYSQLHAVILSKKSPLSEEESEIAELASRVKLPVVSIVKRWTAKNETKRFRVNHYVLNVGGEAVHALAKGISREKTQELFDFSSAPNFSAPEPVRVADLIAEQVTLKWNSLGLA
jgi:endonuclease V-like protein UPF0215 family